MARRSRRSQGREKFLDLEVEKTLNNKCGDALLLSVIKGCSAEERPAVTFERAVIKRSDRGITGQEGGYFLRFQVRL